MEGEKWTLEGQKTEMARQQRRHLAWSGQALVANSVSVMEEAVDQIRATHRAVSPTRGIHAIKEPGLLTISWLLPT